MTTDERGEPVLVLRPPRGWRLPDVAEMWRFREVLFTLAGRDLRLRYKQTAIGVGWVVLRPLIGASIFAFLFGTVARFEAPGGVPYFLFAFAGMIGWSGFSGTFDRASISLLANAALVGKVYFPRLLLPLSTSLSAFVDVGVGLGLYAVLAIGAGATGGAALPLALLLAPVFLGLLLLLALALGTIAAALSVRYRDAQHLVPVASQFLLYLSPVAYPTAAVDARVGEPLATLYHLNPLVGLLEGFRFAVLGVGAPPWDWVVYAAAVTGCAAIVAALVFRRLEPGFADVL